jgi:hypothetical protein
MKQLLIRHARSNIFKSTINHLASLNTGASPAQTAKSVDDTLRSEAESVFGGFLVQG